MSVLWGLVLGVGWLFVGCLQSEALFIGVVSPPLLTPSSEHECASFWALNSFMSIVLSVPC